MKTIDIAQNYIARGWAPIPVPFRQKKAVIAEWQKLRIDDSNVEQYFNGRPSNVGILVGEPSGWIIDIDLDHPLAVAMAPDYLPPTASRFGRQSNQNSHWIYRVTAPAKTVQFEVQIEKNKRKKTVEYRSTGCQTVFPGSVHPSGEVIEWDEDGEPLELAPDELLACVRNLAEAVALALGLPLKGETAPTPPVTLTRQRVAAGRTSVLDRCIKYLAKVPPGIAGQGGHNATFYAACLCIRFGLNEAEAMQAMESFNARCQPPWSSKELEHKLKDARVKVADENMVGVMIKDRPASPAPVRRLHDGDTASPERYNLTDAGNAARFAREWRHLLLFDATSRRWRTYDGKRWAIDERDVATKCAKKTARAMFREATSGVNTNSQLAKWALKSESRDRLAAMIALAKSEDGMTIVADQWDSDPWAFNCGNGTVNLRTGQLQPHNPDDLLTHLSPVEFEATADAPQFSRFLNQTFNGDAALSAYVLRLLGYSLCASRTEHILAVMYGTGANGKTTLLDAVGHVMGTYFDQAAPDLLTDRKGGDEHPTATADLRGKRLVICSESEKNRRLKVATVKRLTGDSTIKGRFMKCDYISFTRTFVLLLVTNNRPKVDEDSEAVWRRLREVPFTVTIPPEQRDRQLGEKLKSEASGILRLLVDGCLAWQRNGLGEAEAITKATSAYREDSDSLGDFLSECCLIAPNAWAASETLRRTYERFCSERGDRPIAGREFADCLKRHGCEPSRRHAGRGWAGIGLLTDMSVTEA